MMLLTRMKAKRLAKGYRLSREHEFMDKAIKFFEEQDRTVPVIDKIGKVSEMLSRVASDLSNYLLTATKESETNRKVLEEKQKKEEADKPSKYDEIY